MRKRQFKKVLSLVLALAMVFSMNTSVFATGNADAPVVETQTETQPETPVTNETETPAAEPAPAAAEPAPAADPAPAAEPAPAADPAPAEEAPKAEEPAKDAEPVVEAPAAEAPVVETEIEDKAGEAVTTITGWTLKNGSDSDLTDELSLEDGVYTIKDNSTVKFTVSDKNTAIGITLKVGNSETSTAAEITGVDGADVFARIVGETGNSVYATTTKADLVAGKTYKIFVVKAATTDELVAKISWNNITTKATSNIDAVIDVADMTNPVVKDEGEDVIDLLPLKTKKVMLSENNVYTYTTLPDETAAPSGIVAATSHSASASSIWATATATSYQYTVSENDGSSTARYGDFPVSGNTPNDSNEFEITDLDEDTAYEILYRTPAVEGTSWASKWTVFADVSLKTLPIIKASDFSNIAVNGITATVPSSERLNGLYFVVSKNSVVAGDVNDSGLNHFSDATTPVSVTKDALNNTLEYETTYQIYMTDSTHSTVEKIDGATFTTDKDMSKSTWRLITDGSITASANGLTKNLSVYEGISENGAILVSSNEAADNAFDGKTVVVKASDATIGRIYTYDGKNSTSTITEVVLSGNNIELTNQEYRKLKTGAETSDVAAVQTTDAADLIQKTNAGVMSVITPGDFPVKVKIFEAVKDVVKVSLNDITIQPSQAITVLSNNDFFTKDTAIGAGVVYDVYKLTSSSKSKGTIIAKISDTSYTTFDMYPLGSTGASIAPKANTLSADGFEWTAVDASTKYARTVSNDVAAFRAATFTASTNLARVESGLTPKTTYFILTYIPAVDGTSFANYCWSSPITTGEYLTLTLTPEFIPENIEADTVIPTASFEVTGKIGKKKLNNSEVQSYVGSSFTYYVDSKVVNDSNKSPATAGIYTVSMDKPEVVGRASLPTGSKTNNYTVELDTSKITVISTNSPLAITKGAAGIFYYSLDREWLLNGTNENVTATLQGTKQTIAYNATSGTYYRVDTKLSGNGVVSSNLTDLTAVKAGETLYVQAFTTIKEKEIQSNVVSFEVKKVPLGVYAEYNFFSVQGEDLVVSPEIKKDTNLDVYPVKLLSDEDERWSTISSKIANPGTAALSSDKISANFAKVDKDVANQTTVAGTVTYTPYDYTLDNVNVATAYADNYFIEGTPKNYYEEYGPKYGYWVAPKFSIDYRSMATEEIVSGNGAEKISSNAAKNIATVRTTYVHTYFGDVANDSTNVNGFGASIKAPSTTKLDSKTKVLQHWRVGHNRVITTTQVAKSAEVAIDQDTTLYAVYKNYSEGEPTDSHGSIVINDIEPVEYTGFQHITNLNHGENWAVEKYYKSWQNKKNVSKDIGLNIRSESENRTLIEGRDYKVSFKNNTNAYQYDDSKDSAKNLKKAPQIVITYIGDYKGKDKDTIYFHINPLDISKAVFGTLPYTTALKATAYAAGDKGQKFSAVKADVKKNDAYRGAAVKSKSLKLGSEYYLTIKDKKTAKIYDSKVKTDMNTKIPNIGWYDVWVNGTGNYSGSVKVTTGNANVDNLGSFYGYDKSSYTAASKLKMTINPKSFKWDGTAKEPAVTLMNKNTAVSADKAGGESKSNFIIYENNVNAGTAKATVLMIPSATNPYYGSKTVTFKIEGLNLPKIETKVLSYNNAALLGRLIDEKAISINGLKPATNYAEGVKYTYSYAQNYDDTSLPGSYKILITGQEEFTGKKKTVTVKVDKANLKAADFKFYYYATDKEIALSEANDLSANYTAAKNGVTESRIRNNVNGRFRRYFNGNLFSDYLTNDEFVKVSYKNNKKSGTGTMVIQPNSKYAKMDKIERTFKINKFDLKDATVYYRKLSSNAVDYEKLTKNDAAKVKNGIVDVRANGYTLKYGKDYEFTEGASDNSVTVTGKGDNYTGTKKEVSPKLFKGLITQVTKVVISENSSKEYTYDGKVKTPQVHVYIGDTEVPSSEYALRYYKKGAPFAVADLTENVDATYKGAVVIEVRGKNWYGLNPGDYGDEDLVSKKTATFKIK